MDALATLGELLADQRVKGVAGQVLHFVVPHPTILIIARQPH